MKRKKNFLVLFVWAASLLGLFAVQVAHADAGHGFYIPDELTVYETTWEKSDSIKPNGDLVALLSSETFNDTVTNYDLTSAYKARILLLGFNWKKLSGSEGLPDSIVAPVKVYFNNAEVLKYSGSDRKFANYFTDVYVIPFGTDLNNVSGRVEVDLSAISQGKKMYTATVTRGEMDDITALRGIWVTDSVTTDKTDTIFIKQAGADGKLVAEDDWNISFKKYSDVKGRARADTLYFEKFDQKSLVHVIKNDKDTLKKDASSYGYDIKYESIGSEIYKVKIEAGNKYTIAVTARDSITKGFYYVTLLDDTVKQLNNERDSLNHMLKDIYLYKKDGNDTVRYELRAYLSGKVGFSVDTFNYKVTAPESAVVGYEAWNKDSIKKRDVIILSYTKGERLDKFFEVRVDSIDDGDAKATYDKTYTIQVLSNDNFLEDLHLSYDNKGEKPLELTSSLSDGVTEYASVDVEWNTKSVFVWATPRGKNAKVDSLSRYLEDEDVFYKELTFKKEPGVAETFLIPVRAEDSTLTKSYKVTVRRKWDSNLKNVTLSAGSDWNQTYLAPVLEQGQTFDVKVPAIVDFDAIEVKYGEKDADYYRVTKTLKDVGSQYSYVIRVATVDRKEETRVDKTYTFNLFHKSNNARLSSLSVTPVGTLSPPFAPEHFEYSVSVPHAQDHIYFAAKPEDDLASANVGGKHNLEVGEQTFSIVVTAENGEKTETYTVTVTRESATGILLPDVSAVYVSGQSLHVSTPVAERVSVYSAGGNLLYSLDKPAGKASVLGLPKGILIVKGSSGWVEKAVVR